MDWGYFIILAFVLFAPHLGHLWNSDFDRIPIIKLPGNFSLPYPTGFVETMIQNVSLEVPFAFEANNLHQEYDFIVVGAGSAGAVIASRLSEIPDWKVLLIEAGNAENHLGQYPRLVSNVLFTDYNWGATMEPQDNACLATENQRCAWHTGKALGGSSLLDYMIFTRGFPEDYDRWASLGNPGWSYQDVLPYFLKSEDAHLEDINEAYHNKGGYLSISNPYITKLGTTFIDAGLEIGYDHIDYNSPEQLGFGKIQSPLKNGRRLTSATAFLQPVIQRKNLHVLPGAKVNRILIDHITNKAFGVEYVRKDKKFTVTASKEVIVSAGALGSSQLLMLSGIGPKEDLEPLGIATLKDLPVGKALYDHLAFPGLVINTNLTLNFPSYTDPEELLKWYVNGKGPLTSTNFEALGFIKTDVSKDLYYPDIELVLADFSIPASSGTSVRRSLRISDEYFTKMYSSLAGEYSFRIIVVLLHPRSKGFLKLKSADPYDYPLFYGNYFSDPDNVDILTMVGGIRTVMQLLETEAFKKIDARLNPKLFVGCEHIPYNSDDYWYCALQYMASSIFHQMATCKMGPAHDPTAVVDHELKLHGFENLRVADTGIIPIPISAHTNAPAIMIGERVSDLVKKSWGAL